MNMCQELIIYKEENTSPLVEQIYNTNKKIIDKRRKYYSMTNNISKEEAIQEIKLTIYNVLKTYKGNKNFKAYLLKSIDNTLLNYIRKINTKKTLKTISLEESKEYEDNRYNPEKVVIKELIYKEIRTKIISKLTWKEELIFTLKEQNFTTKEISSITDMSMSTIYNLLTKIKSKSIKYLS